jgi:hypothetical protein
LSDVLSKGTFNQQEQLILQATPFFFQDQPGPQEVHLIAETHHVVHYVLFYVTFCCCCVVVLCDVCGGAVISY